LKLANVEIHTLILNTRTKCRSLACFKHTPFASNLQAGGWMGSRTSLGRRWKTPLFLLLTATQLPFSRTKAGYACLYWERRLSRQVCSHWFHWMQHRGREDNGFVVIATIVRYNSEVIVTIMQLLMLLLCYYYCYC